MPKNGESKYAQLNDGIWLYKKYWVERLNSVEIAKEVSCCPRIVRDALKRKCICRRTTSEAHKGRTIFAKTKDREWLNQKYWEEHCRINEIAKEIGCSYATVNRALKKNDIVRRNPFSEEHKEKIADKKRKLSPIQRRLNATIRSSIYRGLHSAKGGQHWETLVGYTLSDLMQTLEKEFRDGMSWDNHGELWHVDHIIPLAKFHYDVSEDPEFKKAWSLGNLQPLLVAENLKKYTKFQFY